MAIQKRILILGGGFAGLYTAMELEKCLKRQSDIEITLVSKENFQVFTPMLHEVAASELGATNAVVPINKVLKKTTFFCGKVDAINLEEKSVNVSHGDSQHPHVLEYDHLVLALGAATHFRGLSQDTEGLL